MLITTEWTGNISAFEQRSGEVLWHRSLPHGMRTRVVEGPSGSILVGTGYARVTWLESANGEQMFDEDVPPGRPFRIADEIASPEAFTNGVLVVTSTDGHVYGLHLNRH